MPAVPDPSSLREIPLFADVDVQILEKITSRLRKRVFPTGTNIIQAQMPGDAVYMIQSGTVKIKVDQANGKEVIIAILGAGAIVGEMSLIDSAERSADVLTQEESTVLWLDRGTFNEL